MQTYKLTLQIKSPVITPFQADTLFGHICWALRYLRGEDALIEFLNAFDADIPPLLISDGFPRGFLPRPILKPLPTEEVSLLLEKYFGDMKEDKVRGLTAIKDFKKQPFIQCKVFKELRDGFSYKRLYEGVLEGKYCPNWFREKPDGCQLDLETCPRLNYKSNHRCISIKKFTVEELVPHNTVSRMTGRVMEAGGFWGEIESYYAPESKIELYLATGYFDRGEILGIFNFIVKSGYGGNKSTGKGYLTIDSFAPHSFGNYDNYNMIMSLSIFVPAKDNSVKGFYEIITKYGKLGGDYAKSGIKGKLHPFKKPIIMMKAGSTFGKTEENIGCLLRDVHSDQRIRHYGYAFPLNFSLVDGEGENL